MRDILHGTLIYPAEEMLRSLVCIADCVHRKDTDGREFRRRSAPANAAAADDISLKGIEFPLRMIISPLSKVQRIERSVPRMEKGLTYCIISPNYDVDCLKQIQNEKGFRAVSIDDGA